VSADDGFCREPEKQFRNLHSDDRETGEENRSMCLTVALQTIIRSEKQNKKLIY
jgi:hypothetical protein